MGVVKFTLINTKKMHLKIALKLLTLIDSYDYFFLLNNYQYVSSKILNIYLTFIFIILLLNNFKILQKKCSDK